MTHDNHRGLVIEYNHLDLPRRITDQNNVVTDITYDATGRKWLQQTTTDARIYAGAVVLTKENGTYSLEAANTSDGRLVYDAEAVEVYPEFYHKDHLGNVRVAFADRNKDLKIELLGPTSEITQQNDYYPFGLRQEGDSLVFHQELSSSRYLYNGKEQIEEIGLYEYEFRWYDPAVGRFTGVDPIADHFPHVTPYNYAENEPVAHIDLWGLQAVLAVTIGADVEYRGRWLARLRDNAAHHHISGSMDAASSFVEALKTASASDPTGIGFVALFSHGDAGVVFGQDAGGIVVQDLGEILDAVNSGEITFTEGSIIYLGGCNAGTSCPGGSFAQALANATGASVVASVNDRVGPKTETYAPLQLVYTTGEPRQNEFATFTMNGKPVSAGSTADVIGLINQAFSDIDKANKKREVRRMKRERSKDKAISPLPSQPISRVRQ